MYSNYLVYNDTGFVLEKYFAPEVGKEGFGGEYVLQTGFGNIFTHIFISYLLIYLPACIH